MTPAPGTAEPANQPNPAVPSTAADAIPSATGNPVGEVRVAVERWADAWSRQAVDDYLASYAGDFRPAAGLSRAVWGAQRRARLTRPALIDVRIENLEIDLEGDRAVARFDQTYRSDVYSDRVVKTLVLVREQADWRIVEEEADG